MIDSRILPYCYKQNSKDQDKEICRLCGFRYDCSKIREGEDK